MKIEFLLLFHPRPNLKNLSRCSIIYDAFQTWNCILCFKILAGAQLEPVFGGSATRFKFFKFGLRMLKIKSNPSFKEILQTMYNAEIK